MMLVKNVSPDRLSYSDFIGLYELRGFEGINGAAQPAPGSQAPRLQAVVTDGDLASPEGSILAKDHVLSLGVMGDGLWMLQ